MFLDALSVLVWLAKIVKIVFTISKTSCNICESCSSSIISLFVSGAISFYQNNDDIAISLLVK